jgi:hypothetical protein
VTESQDVERLIERLKDNNWRNDEAVTDTLGRWITERCQAAAALSTQKALIEDLTRERDGYSNGCGQLQHRAEAAEARLKTVEAERAEKQHVAYILAAIPQPWRDLIANLDDRLKASEARLDRAVEVVKTVCDSADWMYEANDLPSPPATREMLQRADETLKRVTKEARAFLTSVEDQGTRPEPANHDAKGRADTTAQPAAAQIREALARAFHDGWLDAINRQPWEDMHDWLALTAADYARADPRRAGRPA